MDLRRVLRAFFATVSIGGFLLCISCAITLQNGGQPSFQREMGPQGIKETTEIRTTHLDKQVETVEVVEPVVVAPLAPANEPEPEGDVE